MQGQLLDGRYKIIQALGAGSFGHTYIAEDTKLYNSRCVVKQLKPLITDPKNLQIARRLFESEAKLLHLLGSHDQIPQLLAHFEENQEFILVQQLIPGHTLADELIQGKQLSEAYTIALLQNILQPLNFVHQNNVVHRDIKPENLIRRQSDGKIVLIDFGAVKQVSSQLINSQGETKCTVAIGTPGYMPTEQASGNPRFSSDIYAVGMIGIQALTGLSPTQLPQDANTAEISWHHLTQVSPALANVLDRMVRYDFRQRYRSATDALVALQQLSNLNAATQPPITPPPSNFPPPVLNQHRQQIVQSPENSSKAGVIAPATVSPTKVVKIGMGFWCKWVWANIWGLIRAGILAAIIYLLLRRYSFMISGLASCAAAGLIVGRAQNSVLQPQVKLPFWWFGTVVSFCTAFVLGVHYPLSRSIFLIGPAIGIIQWLILRTEVKRAGWWVLVNALGGWIDCGIISGWVLAWLLRKQK
jgi:tRNA A-37 threonylcarbamoyl transferase component Bud32